MSKSIPGKRGQQEANQNLWQLGLTVGLILTVSQTERLWLFAAVVIF